MNVGDGQLREKSQDERSLDLECVADQPVGITIESTKLNKMPAAEVSNNT